MNGARRREGNKSHSVGDNLQLCFVPLLLPRWPGYSDQTRLEISSVNLGTHVRTGLACLVVPALSWTVLGPTDIDELNYER
jgi:hypothetical protein